MPATRIRNANTLLRDNAIRHALLLHDYGTGEVHRMMRLLNTQLEPALVRKIATSYDDLEIARAQALQQSIRKVIAAGYERLHGRFDSDMVELAQVDAGIHAGALGNAVPVGPDVVTPPLPTLREMVSNRPIDGKFVKDIFAELSASTAMRVNQQIMIGLSAGEGIDAIVNRVRGTRARRYADGALHASRRHLETMVRTAVAGVSDNVRQATFEANRDLVKAVVFVATLDLKTCPHCGDLDGRTYPLDGGPRVPIHPNCRCSRAPVVRSWKELGFELKDIPEGMRASMDGQVPATVTFAEWIEQRSLFELQHVLGRSRAVEVHFGRLKLRDLLDDNSRVLSLAELRKRAS